MAIKGKIEHKGIEVEVPYIKVSIIGISENIVRVAGENFDQKAIDEAETQEEKNTLFYSMTVPVKKFILQFGYSLKPGKDQDQFGNGQESVECDINENLFTQAYEHLAAKFSISKTEI